jgi:hypothetical protein
MEDRKRRFDGKTEVRGKIASALKAGPGSASFFDGVHVFTPHCDVPDDSALRMVVLPPEKWYSREESRLAVEAVLEWMRNNGSKPRHRWNRLLFLAADHSTLSRLSDAARVALAWRSIVEDVKEGRLNIDQLQKRQAEKELETAEEVLPRAARECYKWLLCPVQETPTEAKPAVEAFPLNTTGSSVGKEMERVCTENELVITTWSPIHLRAKLKELYWKEGNPSTGAMAFWEDTLRYLYLPRLKDRGVLAQAIRTGAAGQDFFGVAYGQRDGQYEGFHLGSENVQFDDTLLLIEPEAAKQYAAAQSKPTVEVSEGSSKPSGPPESAATGGGVGPGVPDKLTGIGGGTSRPRSFHGTVDVSPATAKMRLVQIADEIVSVLVSDPNASVKVIVEISAEFPDGAKDTIKRAVNENARSLGLKSADWE